MSERLRLQSIDALRGLAAGYVVIYHFWTRYFPALTTNMHVYAPPLHVTTFYCLTFPLQYGYIGVSLFFVISGFCIHLPQAVKFKETGSDRLSIPNFARRRFFRLYPAYFVSILLSSLILGLLPLFAKILKLQLPHFASIFGLRFVLLNATFTQFVDPNSFALNPAYWTLVYEVQFYALYPLLLWVVRRSSFTAVLAILFAIEALCDAHPLPVHNLFIDRYFEWFAGMFAVEMVVQGAKLARAIPIAFPGLLLGLIATFSNHLWPWRDLFFGIGCFGLVLSVVRAELAVAGSRGIYRLIHLKAMVKMGLSSYSLYLIHVPIVDMCWRISHVVFGGRGVVGSFLAFVIPICCIPLPFMIAPWWYRHFEEPFLNSRPRKTVERATPGDLLPVAADTAPETST